MIPARWRLPLFALLCAAQLFVAGSIIFGKERVLTQGELYRFRTAPVDPADIVRGRYVALRFQETQAVLVPGDELLPGQLAYAGLMLDAEGFARIGVVRASPPEEGDYLKVAVTHVAAEIAHFDFPVDRFYMPEEQAPIAEREYREAQGEGRGTWAEIRVHEGNAVIEQLYVDGVPAGVAAKLEPTEVPAP